MPSVIRGGFKSSLDPSTVKNAGIKYTYPEGINLRPDTEKHNKLRDMILDRAFESRRRMSARYEAWREIDRYSTGYMLASEAEKKVKEADTRKPISIVVPTSYANKQVLLTYHMASLMSETIFKYKGVGPEDIAKGIIMEHLVDFQVQWAKMLLNLHTMASDAYQYNLGICALEWVKKKTRFAQTVRTRQASLFDREPSTESITGERVMYEGNSLMSIDPYEYLPDPHYEAHNIQAMEHVGWLYRTNYFSLLRDEMADPANYFNCRYVEFIDGRSQLFREGRDDRSKRTKVNRKSDANVHSKPVDVLVEMIDLIPSQWDLGAGKYPETWMFKVAGDEVIIDAGPLNLEHGMKPAAAASPDFDGHSLIAPSRMEMDAPLQEAVNFMYNSHIANVRKAVNNILVADPGLANYNDLMDTKDGAVIRMRKSVWGLGRIKDAVMQLPINDVTRQNMQVDVPVLMGLQDRITGAQDAVSGVIANKKERVSSFESRQAAVSATSRLEKDSNIMYYQAYQDIATMMAFHNIQFMDEETYVEVAEGLIRDLPGEYDIEQDRVRVKKALFENFRFNVRPNPGTIPGNRTDPSALNTFLQTIARDPAIASQFDIIRIVKNIGRELGIRNVHDFERRQPVQGATAPDQVVQQQAQDGNIVPLNGGLS